MCSTTQLVVLLLLSATFTLTTPATFWETAANRLLDQLGVRRTLFDLNEARHGRQLVTNLDRYRGLLVLARHYSLWRLFNNIDNLYDMNRKHGKMQPIIPPNIPFPCNLTNRRSTEPPASVNRLRPGDIDVIASFGDSLAAGNGVISESLNDILNEYRGLTFSGGGYKNWRTVLTLPNILKVFNPKLYGYSTDNGLTVDSVSRLNIAEPMLMSRDLPYQATVLISRMRRDPYIDMQRHWKLLTIFIGNNDICSDMCHHESMDEFILSHERDLNRTLTLLRNQVPRMLVNLIPAPNMITTLHNMHNVPLVCQAVHSAACHCVFSRLYNATYLRRASKQIKRWQQVEKRVARFPEFQTDDFAVVYHPFMASPPLETLRNGDADLRFFASDCFHFSQLGHAGVANTLWNSMLQPIGKKQKVLTRPFEHFECPSTKRPFIVTLGNT